MNFFNHKNLPNHNIKKLFLVTFLLINFILIFLVLILKLNIITKILISIFLVTLFLSILSLFEIVSSFVGNIIFWFIISSLLAYINVFLGGIIFILALLKILNIEFLKLDYLKSPFSKVVVKNYNFLLLTSLLTLNFYFYPQLVRQEKLPLSFDNYQTFITTFNKWSSLIKIKIPFEEKMSQLILSLFQKYQIPQFYSLLLSSNLSEITFKEFVYESLEKNWQNFKMRIVYLLSFLLTLNIIFYGVMKFFSPLITTFSFIFYYLFQKIGLIKIVTRSASKEFIEL